MRKPSCIHCNGTVDEQDTTCPHCGIPLLPGHHKRLRNRFIFWFIIITLFCLLVMYVAPPDWSSIAPK